MMTQKKDKLQELLNKRSQNPLKREAVQPADFYGSNAPKNDQNDQKKQSQKGTAQIDVVKKMQEISAEQTAQVVESLAYKEELVPLSEMKIKERPVNTTSGRMLKFASYIPVETHRALRLLAIQEDKKMYEVIRDAIEYYMQKRLGGS